MRSCRCNRENRHRGLCNSRATIPGAEALNQGSEPLPEAQSTAAGGRCHCCWRCAYACFPSATYCSHACACYWSPASAVSRGCFLALLVMTSVVNVLITTNCTCIALPESRPASDDVMRNADSPTSSASLSASQAMVTPKLEERVGLDDSEPG